MTIKKLNSKVDSLYMTSLEEARKKDQLQDRLDDMEKQIKTASPSVYSNSIISSSAVYSLLNDSQQQIESMKSQLSENMKERDSVAARRRELIE